MYGERSKLIIFLRWNRRIAWTHASLGRSQWVTFYSIVILGFAVLLATFATSAGRYALLHLFICHINALRTFCRSRRDIRIFAHHVEKNVSWLLKSVFRKESEQNLDTGLSLQYIRSVLCSHLELFACTEALSQTASIDKPPTSISKA